MRALATLLSSLLKPPGEPAPAPTEAGLIERARRGDPEAFGTLYEQYYDPILGYLFRRTLSVAIAEDLTSETFLKALRALPKYKHKTAFKSWLYQIATNELRMHWRARRRHPQAGLGPEEDWQDRLDRIAFSAPEIEAIAEREEAMARYGALHAALKEIPEPYQTALVLRYFEDLPYEQVAQAMDKRLGTIKSLLSRGLDKLREVFLRRRATR
jgi:RNA polymerase sigma-70 factor (ECF subfamily)